MSNPVPNTARGEVLLDFMDPPRLWSLTLREEIEFEKLLADRRHKHQGFDLWVGHVIGTAPTEDLLSLITIGCRKYSSGQGLTEDEVADSISHGALTLFKAVFADWAINRYPPGAKKKLEEASKRLLKHLGVDTETHGTTE